MNKVTFDFENNPAAGSVSANKCNAIMFKNACRNTPASNIMFVNGCPVYEGEQLILSCDRGEVDTTEYNVYYTGAGASNSYVVVRKFVS